VKASDVSQEKPGWNDEDSETETTVKLRRLHSATRQMMQADSKHTLFQTVTEAATELLGFEFNTVRRHDEETAQLIPVAVSPTLRDESGDRQIYERGETVQWEALDKGEILVFQEITDIDDKAKRSGEGSMIVVPLDEFGVLTMGSPEPRTIGEDDRQLARVFGANIETAINRVERLKTLSERERRLTERAQQIAVMNRGLRHNVRNELNLLMGWLTELERTVTDENTMYIQRSLQAARKIDSLAKQTRNIQEALSEDHEIRQLDIVKISTKQLTRVRKEYPAVSIESELPESAPALAVGRIREGIWEALENAIIHNNSEQPCVRISIDKRESKQHLTIADNGPGIPRQERQVLSDEIEHKLQHGSGLGLWYLKWLVDRSDASLTFGESEFKTGTALQLQFRVPNERQEHLLG
jgi:signal transduction histidine kinase